MQIENMPMARVFFSKTGRARFISHLDTMRTLTRAFRRSGLPVWYTQGFNPHLYMTFALPLALGYESLRESADIRLVEEIPFSQVTEGLNRVLPPGFLALETAPPVQDPKEIAFADYNLRLIYAETPPAVNEKLGEFLAQPTIEVLKKTKKGEKLVDVKPLSEVLELSAGEDALELKLRMAVGLSLNINPTLFLDAFHSWLNTEPETVRITRTAVLDGEKREFR